MLRFALGAVGALLVSAAATATTTINHQFTPATINQGDVSQYRITIANDSLIQLTAADVTVVLPPEILIAGVPNISNFCGFIVNSASPGSSTVYLTGGIIPPRVGVADGQCFFQVDVTSVVVGNHTAVIPPNVVPDGSTSGYTADENGTAVFNSTEADATLAVNALAAPTGSKVFSPSTMIAGDPTTLTITLSNPNAAATMPLTTFTDALPTDLPAGMVVANPASASTSCSGVGFVNGAVTATPGSGTITLTGGTIGRSGTCTITAKVIVTSITGTSQVFNNTVASGSIGNTRGLISQPFNKTVTVNTPIGVTKTFQILNIPAGQPSRARIVITNSSAVNLLTITSFVDDLNGTTLRILNLGSPVPAPNPVVACTGTGAVNGSLTAPADLLNQAITLTGAKAGHGGSCTIDVYLTSSSDGSHNNTIPANAVVNPNNYASPGPVIATLTANAQLTVAKSVSVVNVAPGQWTEFSVDISNFAGDNVTGVTFKDLLPSSGGNQMTLFNAGFGLFSDPGPGCSGGTFTGLNALGGDTTLAPTAADAGLLWTGGTIAAGSGATPGLCTIHIWAKLPAATPTGLTFTNSIPIGSITGTSVAQGGVSNINAGAVNVFSIASGAVTKAFTPNAIPQGGLSTLTIIVYNRTVTQLTGISLTDNLPPGLTLAANPAPTSTCGGSLQAFPNDTQVILTGGTVATRPDASQESICTLTVQVTGSVLGVHTNSINPGDFSNDQGVVIPASVTAGLTINTGLNGTKTFTPPSVAPSGVSRVTITVSNTSSGALTNVSVNDSTFTAGLTVGNPANASTSCAGPPTLVANPGATSAQMQGATLPAGSSCDFSFNVATSGAGPWTNTIPVGGISSAEGPANTAAVSATLTSIPAQININKSFNPVIVTGGVPSVLQIDVINPSAIFINGVTFTDTFPVGIVVYSVPNAGTDCAGGTVTAVSGGGSVRLSGATLSPNATCHVFVTTTSTRFLNLTNTIPANSIVSTQGYTNPSGTSATLSTLQGLGIAKAFSPAYVVVGQTSTLQMTLVSSFDPNAPSPLTLTGLSYTDNLPNGVFIAATPNASTTCAGAGLGGLATVNSSNGGSNGLVTISQGTIQPGTTCTISIDVVANALGAYNNLIPANAVTTDQGVPNSSPASATLFVVTTPTIAKSFANATRNPGQSTVLTVTIFNGSTVPLTGVALTDTLPAGLSIASPAATGGTCTASEGIVSASPGGSTLSLTGATIAASSNCTFFASVVGNTPGTYVNSINGPGNITDEQFLTNSGSAQATVIVTGPPGVAKAFTPVSISAGGTSTMTLTLSNPSAGLATLTSDLVDALPGNVFVAASPNIGGSCTVASVTAVPGGTTVTYASGAKIPAAGSCTILVDVTSSVVGVYTNLIAAGQLTTDLGTNPDPASASLSVGGALVPPTMAKTFSPTTILVGGTSTLTITLGNTNAGDLTLSSPFVDTLPANVLVAPIPNSVGSCPGLVTALAGAGTITYASGATIPPGGCTIIVDVTSSIAGSYTNTLAAPSLVTDGGHPVFPTTAGLVVDAPTPPTVVKSFSPTTINPGGTSTLLISLGNSNGSDITLTLPFTDNLPPNVARALVSGEATTCPSGVVSSTATSVTLTGGTIPTAGCTISMNVTSNLPGGPYTNTIAAGALHTSAGNNGAPATANLFVNPFQPPSVTKSFSPTIIAAGGISTLTISIANGNAVGASLTSNFVDTLPGPGLVIATPPNLLTFGCTALDVLAPAGGTTVTYTTGGAIPGNGACVIQVNVTSSTLKIYSNNIGVGAIHSSVGNNAVAATATLQVEALPTVAKSFAPSPIPLGASSILTITLGNANTAPAPVVPLVLTADFVDSLPVNLVLGTPATLTGSCPALSIIAVAGATTVTYKNGSTIPAGGCTIKVPVTSAVAGTYINSIPIGAIQTAIGGNPAPASAQLDILQADLSILKNDFVASVVPGTATTYTIVVSNAGPSPVANAAVADTLPPAITSASWSCVATPGSSCGALNGVGNIATTASLVPGGTATYTVIANISPSAVGTVVNTATVTAPPTVAEINPGNNTSTDTDTLTPQADMQAIKSGPATVVPGQSVTYTITETNAGPSTAVAVTLADTLPPGTTFVSFTPAAGWACSTPPVGSGGLVSCSIATLAPAAQGIFTLVVNVAASVPVGTVVTNAATAGSSTPDLIPGNNTGSTSGTSTPSADLSIVKIGPATAVPGGPDIVFTTVVTNNGPSDAQNVSVADPTPAGLTFSGNTGGCTGAFPCSLGTVIAGAIVTITSTYTIPSSYPAPSPVVNIATVSSTTPDPTPANNSSTATVGVPTGVADIAVLKTVNNPTPAVGSTVTFTITVTNLGPSDATGVEITDVLPTGLTFVSATPSQGSYSSATGIWSVGSILLNATKTLQIDATVTQAGAIVNTAVRTAGDQTDPNSSNNSGSATVNGPPAIADIQVQKTVDVPNPGVLPANVTFMVTVFNAGPSTATNVEITDQLPPGLAYSSHVAGSGTYVPGTGVWSIGTMINGATTTLSIVATVPSTPPITYVNLAQKTGETEFDPNTANDQASAVVTVGPLGTLADLSIQKTDSPDPVRVGQNLTYTLLVTNHGPDDATNVAVTDILPAAVTLVSSTSSQGACGGTTTLTCLLGGLAAGNSASITVVVSVQAAAAPSITNTATVDANEADPNPADNTSTAPTAVIPIADVSVAKIVSNSAPLVSETFTFTVTVLNNGPSTANGIVVTDFIPANLGFLSSAATLGSYNNGSGLWTVGTLANGASATLTLTVTALIPGAFTNTATKTAETENDPDPTNDSASAGGGVGVVADLTILKTHAPATFLHGSTGTFSLAVSNVGTGPTIGSVTVSDTLPAGLTPTAASGAGWTTCTVAAQLVTCSRSDVLTAPGSWPPISVTVSVAQSAAASIPNTATVSGGGDITPANDSSTDVVPIDSQADLALVKTGPVNAIPGNNIVYTLVVTNNGPSDSVGVVLSDPTPTNLTFIPTGGLCGAGFPCNLGTILSGASVTVTATFLIPTGYTAPTPIVNAASVTATTTDPTPSNNASSVSTSVAADLLIVKTVLLQNSGLPVTYQIVVTNLGPSSATNVTMTDPLPATVTFQSVTTTQGSCSGASTVTCALGTLANGASATVEITVLPDPAADSITNTASVTATEFDPDPTNNSSTAVRFRPNIPTLSEWGLLALAAALALAGILVLRRRS